MQALAVGVGLEIRKITYTAVCPARLSPAMNSLSKKCEPSLASVTMNGDAPAPMFAYAEPFSAGVDGTTASADALVLTSNSTQLNQAVPVPLKVTAGSLAASYV